MTGSQFRAFYDDPSVFPEGAYHDDVLIRRNGEVFIGEDAKVEADVQSLLPADAIEIESGFVVYPDGRTEPSLPDLAARWMARQSEDECLVRIPRAKREDLQRLVEDLGGSIVSG